MVGFQHEVLPGLSAEVSYNRRWFGTFRVSDNLIVAPTNYSEFCVTAPIDSRSRLPNSGEQICGLFDVAPTLFGQSDNVITRASDFGKQERVFEGVDIHGAARQRKGVILQAGASIGRMRTASCLAVDSPGELCFCETRPPLQTQTKASLVYPLPWFGLNTSLAYQGLPGPEITASWAAPAKAMTGLGRPLAGGARTVTVALIQPGTMDGERLDQLDFRISKSLQIGRARMQPQLDFYNLLFKRCLWPEQHLRYRLAPPDAGARRTYDKSGAPGRFLTG
jgi:hypothetical protein